MRTFVLGDLHGAYKALLQVFERSGFDHEKDTLISLGDIADGWPEVPECVEELLKVRNLIAIRGNHDLWASEFLRHRIVHEVWKVNGGHTTVNAYLRSGLLNDARHREFFAKQQNYYIDRKKRLFVHAGYDVSVKLEKQDQSIFHWNRTLWKYAMLKSFGTYELDDDVNKFKEVFIGHSNTVKDVPDLKPVNRLNVWNLDQGCKIGGKLTLMNVDTKEYFQSDEVDGLYKAC
jgi:serine/threonine protein phosphatase 1